MKNNNYNKQQHIDKIHVNLCGLDGSVTQFIFDDNPCGVNLDKIYIKYEQTFGTPKQYISLFFLNTDLMNTATQPNINLQLIINNPSLFINRKSIMQEDQTDDSEEEEEEEEKEEIQEELKEEKEIINENKIDDDSDYRIDYSIDNSSDFSDLRIDSEQNYLDPNFKDELLYSHSERKKFKSYHMTLKDLLNFEIPIEQEEIEQEETETERNDEEFINLTKDIENNIKQAPSDQGSDQSSDQGSDQDIDDYDCIPNKLPKYNDKLLTKKQVQTLLIISQDYSPYAYNINNMITLLLLIGAISSDIILPNIYHKKNSEKSKLQIQEKFILGKFLKSEYFDEFINKNFTNITCPFPIRSIDHVGTKIEQKQWYDCLKEDWMCKDSQWGEYYKCPKKLIPQVCEDHGFRNITIITNNQTADNCMDLYHQFSNLNDLKSKLNNQINLIVLSLVLINLGLIIIYKSQRKCNKEFKNNIKQSHKNLNKLTEEIREIDSNFQVSPNRIKEILVQYFEPISWPVIYLLACISINSCRNKFKDRSQNIFNNISQTCYSIYNICNIRNIRRNENLAPIQNNDLLLALSGEDHLAVSQI